MLVLASASPRRSDLLSRVGVAFDVRPPHVDEPEPSAGQPPDAYARAMAQAKAQAADSAGADYVIGMDTVVVVDEVVLGKPADDADARSMLQRLRARDHHVITGWCLIRIADGEQNIGHVSTRVTFADVPDEWLTAYVATGEPADKAGAYAIQGRGAFLVREINGSYTNVVGLPLVEVLRELETFAGIRPWTA